MLRNAPLLGLIELHINDTDCALLMHMPPTRAGLNLMTSHALRCSTDDTCVVPLHFLQLTSLDPLHLVGMYYCSPTVQGTGGI
jgi:hypothetical protein